jgi:hypothetical protein
MANVNEQMDEMLGSSYIDDTTTKMPSGFEKVQRKLRAEDRGEGKVFVDKPDADERIKSHMTGMAIGSAALPSDAVSLANETSQFVKNDELLSALFPNLANAADGLKTINEFVGRPGFEELIKAMGIKSDPKNPDQIAGEMMSPAFYGPAAKTIAKLSKDALNLLDEVTASVKTTQLQPQGANIGAITKVPEVDTFSKPTINLNEVGGNTVAGKKGQADYVEMENRALKIYKSKDKIPNEIKDNMYYMTGAYRDAEGFLKYKIPTADAQLNVGLLSNPKINVISKRDFFNADNLPTEGLRLEEVLNFKDLYNQYPDLASNLRKRTANTKEIQYGILKDIRVKNFDTYVKERGFDEKQIEKFRNSGTRAIYARNGEVETIFVSSGKLNEVKSDLLHEIQHAIQRREGHPTGAAPEDFLYNEKTEFGAAYVDLVDNIAKENKILKNDFIKTDGYLDNVMSDTDKIFDSAVEKLMLIKFNKTFADAKQGTKQFYKPIPVDQYPKITDRGELIVDSTKNIMEKQAHIMYENVIGEKQARKVQNDQDIYAQKVKEAREKGVLKPNQDFDAETKERIFRSIKPSRYNVYRGQPDKTLDQDVDIVANIKEQ